MTLQEQLDAVHAELAAEIPDLASQFDADTDEQVRRGVGTGGPQVGDPAPDFELPDQLGRAVRSVELRRNGPLVIAFYRGHWCPYCNLELRALQQHAPQMAALGGFARGDQPASPG